MFAEKHWSFDFASHDWMHIPRRISGQSDTFHFLPSTHFLPFLRSAFVPVWALRARLPPSASILPAIFICRRSGDDQRSGEDLARGAEALFDVSGSLSELHVPPLRKSQRGDPGPAPRSPTQREVLMRASSERERQIAKRRAGNGVYPVPSLPNAMKGRNHRGGGGWFRRIRRAPTTAPKRNPSISPPDSTEFRVLSPFSPPFTV